MRGKMAKRQSTSAPGDDLPIAATNETTTDDVVVTDDPGEQPAVSPDQATIAAVLGSPASAYTPPPTQERVIAPPPVYQPGPPSAASQAVVAIRQMSATKLADTMFWIKAQKIAAGLIFLVAVLFGIAACGVVASADTERALGGLVNMLAGMAAMVAVWIVGAIFAIFLIVNANHAADSHKTRILIEEG
ncbi:MAG: hypothetical protein LBE83_09665 [Propionibacteriaceae bacterium]|jgi:hypothetical protein|nr:hypothetical protein [Propionibacteriaceae bacterium]